MLANNWVEGRILGHEFAGTTDDGTPVAVQPNPGCGHCDYCDDGYPSHCTAGARYIGIVEDGGMAEYVRVPEHTLFKLPSGIELSNASLIEPLAVAAHGLNRARVTEKDRVLVTGAGPIGLATGAVLQSRGMNYDIAARYEHQLSAAHMLSGNTDPGDGYDVVVDAVGTTQSITESINRCKPLGRIACVGSLWESATLNMAFCAKEVAIIAAATYRVNHSLGEFHEAGKVLSEHPVVAEALISHRFPLEAATEAFATAGNRASGAIKVTFNI